MGQARAPSRIGGRQAGTEQARAPSRNGAGKSSKVQEQGRQEPQAGTGAGKSSKVQERGRQELQAGTGQARAPDDNKRGQLRAPGTCRQAGRQAGIKYFTVVLGLSNPC